MKYLLVGNTAYLRDFDGNPEELVEVLGESEIRNMLIEGVVKVAWGKEGEEWVYINQIFQPQEFESAIVSSVTA